MRQFIEGLETRRLLANVMSLVIGDVRFFSEELNGVDGLYRSDLDGSNTSLVKTLGTTTFDAEWLTEWDGDLYFTARTGSASYYGKELWKSDGTSDGTVVVRDIYGGAQGSNPHDLIVLNDHLVFQAMNTSRYQEIFTSDGTRDGTVQLIAPAYPGPYYSGFHYLQITENLIYAEIFNSSLDQTERWQTDGSQEGTVVAPAAARVVESSLRVFGSAGDDQITLDSSGGVTRVTINGTLQEFTSGSFTSIAINALEGDDSVVLSDAITQDALIYGNGGLSTLRGGRGDDTIRGLGQLSGGAGDDALTGEGTLLGGEGNDTITGGDYSYSGPHLDGETILDGGAGNDLIRANAHPATLIGGDGNDTLFGSGKADSLSGGAGDDSLSSTSDDDTLDGGAGHDTLVGGYGVETFIFDEDDTVIDDDPIHVNSASKLVAITGTLGDDVVWISLKAGDPQTVVIRVNDQTLELPVSEFGHLNITTSAGNDDIAIDAAVPFDIYANFIDAGAGNDTIVAGSGSNIIAPGTGSDFVDGNAAGDDRLTYQSSQTAISKADGALKQIVSGGETDTYVGMESIIGSELNDTIVVDAASDSVRYIAGGEGDDVLRLLHTPAGAPGVIYGEDGADTLTASDHDTIGSDASDTVIRDNGAQAAPLQLFQLVGTALTLDGTGDDDVIAVTYRKGDPSKLLVSVNGERHLYAVSSVNSIIVNGGDGDDTIKLNGIAIESRIFGGAGNDVIYGSQAADRISGGEGDDWINGQGGNDVIYGEAGNDRLFGGDGRDYIHVGGGINVVRGGGGTDRIIGSIGLDDLRGNPGDVLPYTGA